MIALGIETSHDQGSVGLTRDGLPTSELLFPAETGPAERLLPALESLLALNRMTRDRLQLICVALGPGSFTSLRIGLAVGKGLAQALHIPIVGVPSMTAYAAKVSFVSGTICVILPDRRDFVYYALYERAVQITAEASGTLESLREQLLHRADLALCVGPGAERHRALLESLVPVSPAALNQPSGALIAQLGSEKFAQTGQDELWSLEPYYVHKLIVEQRTERRFV